MTDDPEEFRRLAHTVVDWIADHRVGLTALPVQPAVPPGSVRAALGALPETPQPFDTLLTELDEIVVPATTQWQSPSFFGYFPANASLHSLLGEMISTAIGTQGMMWATSPACTEVEQHLMDGLAEAFGLPSPFTFAGGGGGTIEDSASSSSLVALLAALNRADPRWREVGVRGDERVYISAETHSSLAKAVRVAGLGADALQIVAPGAGSLAMSAEALATMMAADVEAGLRPVFVCPTIGTTGTGAVDPVRAIAAVAAAHGAWVHVDAAWAGVVALCPEHRTLLDGVELVDSFCTDAHKWLLTAFDASLLWVRDAAALPAALSITPEFLRNAASESGAVVDYRDWQVPLGRRFRSLKLRAVIHARGLDGLRTHLRGHIQLAAQLESWIVDDPRFVLAAPRSLALVCVRLRAGDDATRAALAQVNASGRAFLTHTTVEGRYVIRIAIGAVSTQEEHVAALWNQLQEAAGVS